MPLPRIFCNMNTVGRGTTGMNLSWKFISKFLSDKVERFPEEVGASN